MRLTAHASTVNDPAPGVERSRDGGQRPLVVIPAFNEAATVAQVVAGVRRHLHLDVAVVDDASSDATAAAARAAGARVISLAHNLGAWGATQTGLRYALSRGYTTVITLDADGQHAAAPVLPLLQAIQRDAADVAIGAWPQRGSAGRRMAWRFFQLITGLSIDDLTSGLRAYSLPAIRLLASERATLLDYQDVGVLYLLRQHGLNIVEIPSAMVPRSNGKSRIFRSWGVVTQYLLHTTILAIANIGVVSPSRDPF